MQRNTSNTGNDNFMLVCDGVKSVVTIPTYVTGNYTQQLSDITGGYHGSLPFPARLDHSHPLNVRTTGETGLTGDLNKVIMPIGTTGKIGSSPYYARQDHQHAFVSNGNANSTLPFTSPYARNSGSGVWAYTSAQTSTAAGTNGTNGNWAKWTRGITGNSSTGLVCGVNLWVVSSIRKQNNGKSAILYMRMCAFDENGCLKSVGLETFGVSVNTVISS